MTNGANKTVLFYEKPVALDRTAHRNSKIKLQGANFTFARDTNSVPVVAMEFSRVATEYPIVFAGPSLDRLMPVVVLGLRNNENVFVDAEGKWTGAYIPAFIRRYPFVLAERPNSQDFAVCIDAVFPGWEAPDGEALFDDEGKEAPLLRNVLSFLGQYQGNVRLTQTLIGKLNELNLLVPKEVRSQAAIREPAGGSPRPAAEGQTLALRGFYAVEESRLNTLSDAKIAELYRGGFLALIYMHLVSLGNMLKLDRRVRQPA